MTVNQESRRRLWRWMLAALAVGGLAAVAVCVWMATRPVEQAPGPQPEPPLPRVKLDHLDATNIPADRLPFGAPPELVAVLGDPRGQHGAAVGAVAFAPDGKRVATGTADGVVRLWDAATLQLRDVHPTTAGQVLGVAFSGNGKLLAASLVPPGKPESGNVWLWDVSGARSERLDALPDHAGFGPCAVAFNAAGDRLAMTAPGGRAHLYDVAARPPKLLGEAIHDDDPTGSGCTAVALTPDGKTLITAGSGKGEKPAVKLWDVTVTPPKERAVLPAGKGGLVTALALDAAGKTLAVRYHDPQAGTGRMETWRLDGDAVKLADTWDFGKLTEPLGELALTPDGKTVLRVGFKVHFWDLEKRQQRKDGFPISGTAPSAAAVSPDGKSLAVASLDGWLRLWPLAGGDTLPPATKSPGSPAVRVVFRPDGRVLAVSHVFGAVVLELWDLQPTQPKLAGGLDAVLPGQAAFTPDGGALVVGRPGLRRLAVSADGVPGGETEWSLGIPEEAEQVAFAGHGRLLQQFPLDKGMRRGLVLWDTSGAAPRKVGRVDLPEPLQSVAISDNRMAVGMIEQGKPVVRLWDTTGTLAARSAVAPPEQAFALALTADGLHLACFTRDGQITVWEVAGTQAVEKQRIEFKTEPFVPVLTFSPNGKHLAAAAGSKVVVWEAASGRRLKEWLFFHVVPDIAFAPDGRHLATANADGTAYILRLPEQLGR
jgi:WD40 repeat protein